MNAAQREALAALPEMQANIAADRVISCSAPRADPGGECWAWLRDCTDCRARRDQHRRIADALRRPAGTRSDDAGREVAA